MRGSGWCDLSRGDGRSGTCPPGWIKPADGRRVHGDEHPHTLISINEMGSLLEAQGKLAEAEPYYREALEGFRRALGSEHSDTLSSVLNTGSLLMAQGKLSEAEPYVREALEGFRRVLGDEHAKTLISEGIMGDLLNTQDRYTESERLLRDSLPIHVSALGEDDWRTAEARSLLGEALSGLGRYAEAEPHLLDGHAGLDASLPDAWRAAKLPASIERLVRLYEEWGKPDEAEEWRAKLQEITRIAAGEEPSQTED